MADIYCWKCGSPNDPAQTDCSNCGTSLRQESPDSQTSAIPHQPEPPRGDRLGIISFPSPGESKGLPNPAGLCILAFFLPLVGIIIGLLYMGEVENTRKQHTGREALDWSLISLLGPALLFVAILASGDIGNSLIRP